MNTSIVDLREYMYIELHRCENLFECIYLAAGLCPTRSNYVFDRTWASISEHRYKPFFEMSV